MHLIIQKTINIQSFSHFLLLNFPAYFYNRRPDPEIKFVLLPTTCDLVSEFWINHSFYRSTEDQPPNRFEHEI